MTDYSMSRPSVTPIQMAPLAPFCSPVDCSAASVSAQSNTLKQETKHRRRYCKHEGCTRIIKSQGLCQRHGAKTRKCKIEGCNKQAQGNFNCMCKAHFKELKKTKEVSLKAKEEVASVKILTSSQISTKLVLPSVSASNSAGAAKSVCETSLLDSLGWQPTAGVMPLIAHLKQGFEMSKPEAWHRNEERQVRGLAPVSSVYQELESWELELAWMETLVLTGNADASFHHLATAWGQAKDFHVALGNKICARNLQCRTETRSASSVTSTDSDSSADVENIYDESLMDDVIEVFLPRESIVTTSDSLMMESTHSEIMEPDIFPKSIAPAVVASAYSEGSSLEYFTRSNFGEEMDRCDIPVSVQFSM